MIVRRYHAGIRNMRDLYRPAMDSASIYDNSDGESELIADACRDGHFVVYDVVRWALIDSEGR